MTALVYILLCLVWGSSWIAIKLGLSHAPPLYTSGMRFLLAWAVLSGIALVRGYTFPRNVPRWLRLGYPGFYMYGVSYALIYFAEQYIDSSLTAVLFGSFPFWVAGLSHWLLKEERIGGVAWIGLLIGFAGVVVISYDQWQLSGQLFLGTMLALAGTFAAAYGMVLHKRLFVNENIVVSTSVQMSVGGVPLLLGAVIFERFSDFTFSLQSVGSIVYLALFATVFTFLSYYWLMRKTTAVVVSLIAFVTPVVAIAIGVPFFGESMTMLTVVGSALILSGIVLVVRKPRQGTAMPETGTQKASHAV